jgi:hypothetical protein
MIGNVTVATRWLSIEGALYQPGLGEWKPGLPAATESDPARSSASLVSVDGAGFDLDLSEYVAAESSATTETGGSQAAEGVVFVDGAILSLDQS